MERINSRRLLIGIGLLAAGVIVVGVGVALGSSVGGAVLASAVLAA